MVCQYIYFSQSLLAISAPPPISSNPVLSFYRWICVINAIISMLCTITKNIWGGGCFFYNGGRNDVCLCHNAIVNQAFWRQAASVNPFTKMPLLIRLSGDRPPQLMLFMKTVALRRLHPIIVLKHLENKIFTTSRDQTLDLTFSITFVYHCTKHLFVFIYNMLLCYINIL